MNVGDINIDKDSYCSAIAVPVLDFDTSPSLSLSRTLKLECAHFFSSNVSKFSCRVRKRK